jgi:hypothetical protein
MHITPFWWGSFIVERLQVYVYLPNFEGLKRKTSGMPQAATILFGNLREPSRKHRPGRHRAPRWGKLVFKATFYFISSKQGSSRHRLPPHASVTGTAKPLSSPSSSLSSSLLSHAASPSARPSPVHPSPPHGGVPDVPPRLRGGPILVTRRIPRRRQSRQGTRRLPSVICIKPRFHRGLARGPGRGPLISISALRFRYLPNSFETVLWGGGGFSHWGNSELPYELAV